MCEVCNIRLEDVEMFSRETEVAHGGDNWFITQITV